MLRIRQTNELRSAYPGEYKPASQFTDIPKKLSAAAPLQDVRIIEDDHYFKIYLAAPGLSREDLLVSINKRGNLLIKGVHKTRAATGYETTLHSRGFRKEFPLSPNIDTDFIKAEFRDGVLYMCFLKTTSNYNKRESRVAVY